LSSSLLGVIVFVSAVTLSNSKFGLNAVDFSHHPVPSILVTEMRRPDESKMAFLRLRSPKEKGMDDVRLKSPVGVYTGEPVPLTASSGYPARTVALLLTCVCLVCLFISGFLNGITPAVLPATRIIWPYNMLLRNGGKGVVPEYPRIKTMFKNEWTYQDSGVQGDAAWRDMLPKGHGVVELRWPEHLKLPKDSHYTTEQEQGGIELAEVSVVKELDCLIKIRSALIGYEYNMKLNQKMKIEVHTCLDYGKCSALRSPSPLLTWWQSGKQ
jgi:hypothetical protein